MHAIEFRRHQSTRHEQRYQKVCSEFNAGLPLGISSITFAIVDSLDLCELHHKKLFYRFSIIITKTSNYGLILLIFCQFPTKNNRWDIIL